MDRLIEGFRRFREGYWQEHEALFQKLASGGQSPRAMVIACADSRASPQTVFQTQPGEIFTVRNVANLVPPYQPDAAYHGTSAALEFAVRILEVQHIVVMGHSSCGGVGALLRGAEKGNDFILPWMDIAARAREEALAKAPHDPAAAQRLGEHGAIKVSLDNLLTFPWVSERVKSGLLELHGCHFDIEHGQLERLGRDGTFAAV